MLDLERNLEKVAENAAYCRERGIILPTFSEMRNPETIGPGILDELKHIGLWDVHPRNLFRITWSNEPKERGGLFSDTNYLALPPELTGCRATIIALVGKWFPTGAHKVGATYGCLAPRLVTGQFDPKNNKAVWPSTGNYCRGGAYVSSLLACQSIAILPEEMSRERFEWLKTVAGEVIATPGCESNVKEIFDKCWELRHDRRDIMIFNQFEEFGNPIWHYHVTGPAFERALAREMPQGGRLFAAVLSSGSAGTLGAGYYLKSRFGNLKIAAAEALQCPTLLNNGFGGHRIEGIGDKHVPWVHDLKNTDVVITVDDDVTMRLLRFFNHRSGRQLLKGNGVDEQLVESLDLLGISGIGNLVASIKLAKYFELDENDYIVTVLTDSLQLYASRLKELEEKFGPYDDYEACRDMECLRGIGIDHMQELNYYDRRRMHNLKYFTWIEQQGRALEELNAQWYDHDNYWSEMADAVSRIDELIRDFNDRAGAGP
jgi:cysteine synthase